MVAKGMNRKHRIKRSVGASIAHVHSTFNNTVIMITDTHGSALTWSSAGSLGFKRSKELAPFATQMAAETTTKTAVEHGLKAVEVTIKGPDSGREAATRSLQATGLEVTATRDVTPVPHNGARPPKRRRV